MSKNFKVTGVGIDTSGMTYSPSSDELYEYYGYVHTSIKENNDYLISNFIREQSGAPLITTIDFTDNMTKAILGHLITLGRDKVDLLLIDSEANWDSPEIGQIIEQKIVDNIGISCPKTLDRLVEIAGKYNNLKFISLSLCPLNFNYDIIGWCETNGVNILGFNPFGGRLDSNNIISSFTAPYLLGFAATYCSVVFLSGRELYYSNEEFKYLNDLIGKETEAKYTLKKNVSRLHKPFKKVISESLSISDDLVIPFDSPEMIYLPEELKFSLKDPIENLKITENPSDSLNEIIKFLKTKENDYNETLESHDIFAMNRYDIVSYLSINYPETDGWELDCRKLGDLLMVAVVRREVKKGNWIKKKKEVESKTFILGMTGKDRKSFYITEV